LQGCEFTFAREIEQGEVATTMCGSPIYMAPERLAADQYNSKAELWSVGIIYYEMLYNSVPWQAENILSLYYTVTNTKLEFPHKQVPE